VRPLPAWGLYARNVEQLTLQDVRFSLTKDDLRPVAIAERVERLNLDNFKFTPITAVAKPVVTISVGKLSVRPTEPK